MGTLKDELGFVGPISGQELEEQILRIQPDLIVLHGLADIKKAVFCINLFPTIRMLHSDEFFCDKSFLYMNKLCGSLFLNKECVTKGCISDIEYRKWVNLTNFHNKFDAITFYSDWYINRLIRLGIDKNKLYKVPPLIYPPRGEAKPESNLILYTGGFEKRKGIEYLLKAVSKLKSKDWTLVVSGGGDDNRYIAKIMRMAKELGIMSQVVFTGYISRAELDKYLLKAKVFAFTSVLPEGYGFAGAEAMMYAIPIVAFDVNGVEEWLEINYNGFKVPVEDVEALANSIYCVLFDDKVYLKLKNNSLEKRKSYLNKDYGRIMNDFLKKISEKSKSNYDIIDN